MNNATLKQIAAQLGISTTTVSKALKNYTDISEKTKKAVIDLAQELNYTPHSLCSQLKN